LYNFILFIIKHAIHHEGNDEEFPFPKKK